MPTNLLPDPEDPALSIADTTPANTDPDAPVSFEAPAVDEGLDPDAFADEPWADLDPEADPGEDDDGSVSFGTPAALADTRSRERWLQSALRALVAPRLVVDGVLGPRSTQAVQLFQRRSKSLGAAALTADGIVGPRTIAALEQLTHTKAPDALEASLAQAQPDTTAASPTTSAASPTTSTTSTTSTPTTAQALTVREEQVDGVTEYVIASSDDQVRFSYWTPAYNKYKPYNVSRYRGARKGLLSDAQILGLGYSSSELKILQANALKESGGAFGAINTWDDQIVSWGMAQFAGQAGTLAVLLADLKEGTPAAFQRWFAANGIDVARGEYPWKGGKTKTGWHVVVTTSEGRTLRGNEGWQHIRTQPRMLGAFMLAGNDPAIQLGQIDFWRRGFLVRAITKRVAQKSDGSGGAAVRRYITSERGLAVLVRLHNWMPGYVVSWSNRFIAELQKEHTNRDLSDPFHWDQALEDAFVQRVCDERKKVKAGSYDTYALDLSRVRGSFKSGDDAATPAD